MSYMDQNIAFAPAGGIQELSLDEIDTVGAAGPLNDAGTALQMAGVAAGGLAMVPTPASLHLGVFALVSGGLGTMISWADSRIKWDKCGDRKGGGGKKNFEFCDVVSK